MIRNLVFGYNNKLDGEPFVIEVKTDNIGTSASNQFTLPLQIVTGLSYDFFVDWGDGEFTTHNTNANVTHTYSTAGKKTISIYGKFEKIYFNDGGDRLKLTDVKAWGDSYGKFANQSLAFYGCSNLKTVPNGGNFGNVTNMQQMFQNCTSFNSDISLWSTGNVTTMFAMFQNCTSFNSDISLWSTGNVTTMFVMFQNCTSFNSDISLWSTGNVTNMYAMFQNCTSFNSNISLWSTGNVTNMSYMFNGCINFTRDLKSWNVSKVLNFGVFMWYGNVPNSTDISFWNFNKNVKFDIFIQYKSGYALNASQFDGFLQKLATAVIGTGRTETNKTIGITPLRITSAGKVHYAALIADGWVFTYGVTVV